MRLIIPSLITKREIEIRYDVPVRREIMVRIYDISGREIWKDRFDLSGKGTKKLSVGMREGVYLIRVEGAGEVVKRKLIVIGG